MPSIGFATWAAPHQDAKDKRHREEWHAHIYPDIWTELERFRVMRGFARELVWYDKATAVGVAAGGIDMAGDHGDYGERVAAAKDVAYGLQAGTIDLARDLPAVAFLTATDKKGVCLAVAHLAINDANRLTVTRWHGEDLPADAKPPLKLDVWSSVEALEPPEEEVDDDQDDG